MTNAGGMWYNSHRDSRGGEIVYWAEMSYWREWTPWRQRLETEPEEISGYDEWQFRHDVMFDYIDDDDWQEEMM